MCHSCPKLWYFNKKKSKKHPCFYSDLCTLQAASFLAVTMRVLLMIFFAFFVFGGGGVGRLKWVNIFERFFFHVRKANPSWMKARDQTRWRLAWIQEKGINKGSEERAGVWKRLLSLLVSGSQIRPQPLMIGHRCGCPKGKTLKRPIFAGVDFSKSGGFLVNQTSVGVHVVLSVHAADAACRPAVDRLGRGYATLAYSTVLALA